MATSKILSKSESFFNFIFDPNTSKKLVRFNLINCTEIHLRAVIEIFHNLITNEFIKVPTLVKSLIQQNKKVLRKFIIITKNLSIQRKIIKRYYKLIFHILIKSKEILFLALNR